MNVKFVIAALGVSAAVVAQSAFADEQPVFSQLDAFVVTMQEDGEENFEPASRADPGAVIEYRVSYENTGETALQNFTVDGRIPEAADYVINSAQIGQQAVFEARTDDIDWSIPPLSRMVEDEAGVLRSVPVPPEEYAGVRWRLFEPLAAGELIEARYRVRVDR